MLDSKLTGSYLSVAMLKQLCMLLLLTGLSLPLLSAPPTPEYKLKAALIYKLTKFIEWPELQDSETPSSFGICLLGEDNFGDALDALQERKALGAPIIVYRHTQSEAIGTSCQILYISESKKAFLRSDSSVFKGCADIDSQRYGGICAAGRHSAIHLSQ